MIFFLIFPGGVAKTFDEDFVYNYLNLPTKVTEYLSSGNDPNPDYYYYKYDEQGFRISKKIVIDGSVNSNEFYLRDQTGREVAVYNDGGTTLQRINLYGYGLVGYVDKENSDKRYYYIKDHLGSIRQVIHKTVDYGSDNVVASKNYQPYGNIIAEYNDGTYFRYDFTEKQLDSEINLHYFGARYYDSGIGRWTTPDPLASKRQGLSPYQYVQNNPLNRFDTDGRIDKKAFVKAVAKTLLSGFFMSTSTLGMAGTTVATIGSSGLSSPVTVPSFLGNFAVFTASSISFGESIGDVITALQTPNGMKAETLSLLKKTVKGLGGDATSQAIAQTIFDAIGMKGIENMGREGIMQMVGVVTSGTNVAEDVIEILNALAEKEKEMNENKKDEKEE